MLALAGRRDHGRRDRARIHHHVRTLDAAQIPDDLDELVRATHEPEASEDSQNISARRLQARLNIPGRSSPRLGSWIALPASAPNITRPTPVE